jgi:hypothetical protein
MNTRVEAAVLPSQPTRDPISLPAGAGVALAVLVGSLIWIGVFALIM